MSTSRNTAQRCLALAQLRLTAVDDQALTDARDYAAKALAELEALREPLHDPVAAVLGRSLKVEHISAPVARVVAKLKAGEG